MAWTAPKTDFAAGNILTAAQMNAIGANLLAGGPIYATEAARNSAITSPFEGQRAYITGSTETAATGDRTIVPNGITTVYDGSNWVTVTGVGSTTDATGTTTSTTFGTLTGGGANPSVTLRTGTSAVVHYAANSYMSTANNATGMGVAVSGATTLAVTATNNQSQVYYSALGVTYFGSNNGVFVFSGLTPGVNTFTLNYNSSNATVTASFQFRRIFAAGIA